METQTQSSDPFFLEVVCYRILDMCVTLKLQFLKKERYGQEKKVQKIV